MPLADPIPRRLIAVALGPKTMAEARAALPRISAGGADAVELRLDYFEEPYDLARLLRRPRPLVIVTNRPRREGGRSELPDSERLASLRQAAELGAEYVDVEWDTVDNAQLAAFRAAGARVIVSRHDFQKMPADFAAWPDQLTARGADVVKVVALAGDARDNLAVFRILADATRPTIAIAMGEAGLPSRLIALRYDSCFLSYSTLGGGERTAPGLLTVAQMREVYQVQRLRPTTAVYGFLGPSEDAGLAWYNRSFVEARVDAIAVPFGMAAAAVEISRAFQELPVNGWYLAGPGLEREALAELDELTPRARARGQANSLICRGGRRFGDWVDSPEEQLARWKVAPATESR